MWDHTVTMWIVLFTHVNNLCVMAGISKAYCDHVLRPPSIINGNLSRECTIGLSIATCSSMNCCIEIVSPQ